MNLINMVMFSKMLLRMFFLIQQVLLNALNLTRGMGKCYWFNDYVL